jgi:hypothetical protein
MDWRFRKDLETRYGKEAVMQLYRDYRNGLNNCLNYQLQSLAAAVVNRAAIQINRKLKELGVDGRVQAQVHDQLIINVPEDKAYELAPYHSRDNGNRQHSLARSNSKSTTRNSKQLAEMVIRSCFLTLLFIISILSIKISY